MSNLYKLFKTDENLEKDGVWLQYGETEDGQPIRIRIARAGGGNTKFAKELEKRTRPYRKALQNGTLDDKTADRIYKEVYAETVVLEWQNITDQDGNLLDFSVENILKVFKDLPDLFRDIQEQSNNVAIFREEMRESDLGN